MKNISVTVSTSMNGNATYTIYNQLGCTGSPITGGTGSFTVSEGSGTFTHQTETIGPELSVRVEDNGGCVKCMNQELNLFSISMNGRPLYRFQGDGTTPATAAHSISMVSNEYFFLSPSTVDLSVYSPDIPFIKLKDSVSSANSVSFTLSGTAQYPATSNLTLFDGVSTITGVLTGGSGTGLDVTVTFNLGTARKRTFTLNGGEVVLTIV